MICAEITLADGKKSITYAPTWEVLFERLQQITDIKRIVAVTSPLSQLRQGRQNEWY